MYGELRALAGSWFRRHAEAPTLQPTALVHEAWVKLAESSGRDATDRAHFFAAAARTMRHGLVDHVRARRATKRGGGATQVALDAAVADSQLDALVGIALDDALAALERESPMTARVVELRFFGGLSGDEAALALGISARTVDREWRFARAWLASKIDGEPAA